MDVGFQADRWASASAIRVRSTNGSRFGRSHPMPTPPSLRRQVVQSHRLRRFRSRHPEQCRGCPGLHPTDRVLCAGLVVGPEFQHLFYSKICSITTCFPTKIGKVRPSNLRPTGSAIPDPPQHSRPFDLESPTCSGGCLIGVVRSGVKAGRRPPVGLGVDAGGPDATFPKPETESRKT